jgi:glycerophosphoryl diester phosphodiesterase
MASMQIIAHRGASAEAPENTLRALEHAWRCGASWSEVDVQRTADAVAILVHDDSWKRTAGFDALVRDTPWAQVAGFDVGSWFAPTATAETVPRLEQVLAWTDRLHLNLEIKSPQNDAGLAAAVALAVRAAAAQKRTLLSCFDHAVIDALADEYDDLQLGYLAHAPVERRHRRVGWQILAADALIGNPEWLESLRCQDGHVWAWTVDAPSDALRLRDGGVDGLITNDPRRLLQALR